MKQPLLVLLSAILLVPTCRSSYHAKEAGILPQSDESDIDYSLPFIETDYQEGVPVRKPFSSIVRNPLWQGRLTYGHHERGATAENKVNKVIAAGERQTQRKHTEIKHKHHHNRQKGINFFEKMSSSHARVDLARTLSTEQDLNEELKDHTRHNKKTNQVNEKENTKWDETLGEFERPKATPKRRNTSRETRRYQEKQMSKINEENHFKHMDTLIVEKLGDWFLDCLPMTMTDQKKIQKQHPFKCTTATTDILRQYSVPCITLMYFLKTFPC